MSCEQGYSSQENVVKTVSDDVFSSNKKWCTITKYCSESGTYVLNPMLFKNMNDDDMRKIIPFLDSLSPEANETQSVNTVYLKNNNIVGHNTDIDGFRLAIKHLKSDIIGKKVLILGAGGVVPSIICALNKMKVSEIMISNRTKSKAENLNELFKNLVIVDWGELPKFDTIINATSIGLNKKDKFKLDFTKAGKNKFFYDVIYNPKETNFLKAGKELGNITENGKLMFIYQAVAAFKVWHGIKPEINNETIEILNK